MTTVNHNKIWQSVLGEIEVQISRANFQTWFKNTQITTLTEEMVTIGVPNVFSKEWLEKKYSDCIAKSLKHLGVNARRLNYEVISMRGQAPKAGPAAPAQARPVANHATPQQALTNRAELGQGALNARYQFETFVVGPFNELAHAAARAVAERPGQKYNPLFIYGGVGLGKTHLLQSIGNYVLKTRPTTKVSYCTSEQFTTQLVRAIKNQDVENFKQRFRAVDVLMIDDIQFIAGKEKTQEELFHTFNNLYEAGKQIVFSADKPPKLIPALEARLRSRFEGGMPVDISFPDFETRLAILQRKLEERGTILPEPVINLIANRISYNIRELEGALNKVVSFCELSGPVTDLSKIENLIGDFSSPQEQTTTFKAVLEHVARHFDILPEDILKKTRKKEVVVPRQIIMYLLRTELNYSFPSIGRRLGGKDHTTVMYAVTKIENALEKNEQLRGELATIKERLYNY